MIGGDRALTGALLVAERRWAQRELDRWLGGATKEPHVHADQLLDRIDQIDFMAADLAREVAV